MAKTFTIKNLAATLENLNMVGTFDNTSATIETAIPSASIGTYQLFDKLISDLLHLKNEIKTEEKKIQAVLAADGFTDIFTDGTTDITLADREAKTNTIASRNQLTITADSSSNKPAVLIRATSGDISEDGIFEFLQIISLSISKIKNNLATAHEMDIGAAAIQNAVYSDNASS